MSAVATSAFSDLDEIANRLQHARAGIEERFIDGGTALMSTHDIVDTLIRTIGEITGALEAGAIARTPEGLRQTVQELSALAETERMRQETLARVLKEGQASEPLIQQMNKALGYLKTCAMATRITGAGMDELTSFADDISSYVGDAAHQVARFSEKVSGFNGRLAEACANGGKVTAAYGNKIPDVAEALTSAAEAIAARRDELDDVAATVCRLAEGVRTRVAKVLSALQIGDVTRQRIEHVEAGVDLVRQMARRRPGARPDAFETLALQLLHAQVEALTDDFQCQTRDIVGIIHGFAGEAQSILALHGMAGGPSTGTDGIAEAEAAVRVARHFVRDIEDSRARAREACLETIETVSDLLSNIGSIGNLRNVRDDIRCLAINAYLRSYRLGPKGRSVGVIATEMGLVAEKLGGHVDDVLGQISSLETATSDLRMAEGEEQGALTGRLDDVMGLLREVNGRMDALLADLTRQGGAAASTIGEIAGGIDFQKGLGQTLTECTSLLASQGGMADKAAALADERLEAFSDQLFALYTMAAERDVHQKFIPVHSAAPAPAAEGAAIADDEDLFEDALF
ncbi:Methyl-accepting chemotaxis protein 1 [Hartmannibacter diazotrophicus]|uniref:Methyl-accepting chemotaxis protein 1 n=1 Tax=Hartmannibacter diazotrophicus TaxID=1482074 RepID=A0A2C9D3C8_9HYPH|nr:hypothetical protein [Hartmannibacter diazotrophicus]SON53975.1 Methyl-accepting chemotaxis protein 1 [Hartmannibacter diazotrophicus]